MTINEVESCPAKSAILEAAAGAEVSTHEQGELPESIAPPGASDVVNRSVAMCIGDAAATCQGTEPDRDASTSVAPSTQAASDKILSAPSDAAPAEMEACDSAPAQGQVAGTGTESTSGEEAAPAPGPVQDQIHAQQADVVIGTSDPVAEAAVSGAGVARNGRPIRARAGSKISEILANQSKSMQTLKREAAEERAMEEQKRLETRRHSVEDNGRDAHLGKGAQMKRATPGNRQQSNRKPPPAPPPTEDVMLGCAKCRHSKVGCTSCRVRPMVTRPYIRWQPKEGHVQKDIPSAPVFYPSEEEFEDPYAYIASIQAEGEKFGIVRIVPPDGWDPPFQLANEESFRFQVRKQMTSHLCLRAAGSGTVNESRMHSDGGRQSRMGAALCTPVKQEPKAEATVPGSWGGAKPQSAGSPKLKAGCQQPKSIAQQVQPEAAKCTDPNAELQAADCSIQESGIKSAVPKSEAEAPAGARVKAEGQPTDSAAGVQKAIQPQQTTDGMEVDAKPPVDAERVPAVVKGATVSDSEIRIKVKIEPMSEEQGVACTFSLMACPSARAEVSTPKQSPPARACADGDSIGGRKSDKPASTGRMGGGRMGVQATAEEDDDSEDDVFGHGYSERHHTLKSFISYSEWSKTVHFGNSGSEDGRGRRGNASWLPTCWQSKPRLKDGHSGGREDQSLEAAIAHPAKISWNLKGRPTVDEIEAEFWRIIEAPSPDQVAETLYGSDLDSGRHGSGFPLPAWRGVPTESRAAVRRGVPHDARTKEYSEHRWNINNLTRSKDSVLRYVQCDKELITGVMMPWLYLGSSMSAFCWHIEDHALCSINYMHLGAPKVWYGVPTNAWQAFEEAMLDALPHLFEEDPHLLHRMVTMLSPAQLKERGVPVYKLVHEAGSFVITFPNAYHGGFNTGFNCAEAVNFGPPDWLPYGSEIIKKYRQQAKACTISHDQLLITLVGSADLVVNPPPTPIKTSGSSEDDESPVEPTPKRRVGRGRPKKPRAIQIACGELALRIDEERERQKTAKLELEKCATNSKGINAYTDTAKMELDKCATNSKGMHIDTMDCDCSVCKCDLFLSAVVSTQFPGQHTLEELQSILDRAVELYPAAAGYIEKAKGRGRLTADIKVYKLGPMTDLAAAKATADAAAAASKINKLGPMANLAAAKATADAAAAAKINKLGPMADLAAAKATADAAAAAKINKLGPMADLAAAKATADAAAAAKINKLGPMANLAAAKATADAAAAAKVNKLGPMADLAAAKATVDAAAAAKVIEEREKAATLRGFKIKGRDEDPAGADLRPIPTWIGISSSQDMLSPEGSQITQGEAAAAAARVSSLAESELKPVTAVSIRGTRRTASSKLNRTEYELDEDDEAGCDGGAASDDDFQCDWGEDKDEEMVLRWKRKRGPGKKAGGKTASAKPKQPASTTPRKKSTPTAPSATASLARAEQATSQDGSSALPTTTTGFAPTQHALSATPTTSPVERTSSSPIPPMAATLPCASPTASALEHTVPCAMATTTMATPAPCSAPATSALEHAGSSAIPTTGAAQTMAVTQAFAATQSGPTAAPSTAVLEHASSSVVPVHHDAADITPSLVDTALATVHTQAAAVPTEHVASAVASHETAPGAGCAEATPMVVESAQGEVKPMVVESTQGVAKPMMVESTQGEAKPMVVDSAQGEAKPIVVESAQGEATPMVIEPSRDVTLTVVSRVGAEKAATQVASASVMAPPADPTPLSVATHTSPLQSRMSTGSGNYPPPPPPPPMTYIQMPVPSPMIDVHMDRDAPARRSSKRSSAPTSFSSSSPSDSAPETSLRLSPRTLGQGHAETSTPRRRKPSALATAAAASAELCQELDSVAGTRSCRRSWVIDSSSLSLLGRQVTDVGEDPDEDEMETAVTNALHQPPATTMTSAATVMMAIMDKIYSKINPNYNNNIPSNYPNIKNNLNGAGSRRALTQEKSAAASAIPKGVITAVSDDVFMAALSAAQRSNNPEPVFVSVVSDNKNKQQVQAATFPLLKSSHVRSTKLRVGTVHGSGLVGGRGFLPQLTGGQGSCSDADFMAALSAAQLIGGQASCPDADFMAALSAAQVGNVRSNADTVPFYSKNSADDASADEFVANLMGDHMDDGGGFMTISIPSPMAPQRCRSAGAGSGGSSIRCMEPGEFVESVFADEDPDEDEIEAAATIALYQPPATTMTSAATVMMAAPAAFSPPNQTGDKVCSNNNPNSNNIVPGSNPNINNNLNGAGPRKALCLDLGAISTIKNAPTAKKVICLDLGAFGGRGGSINQAPKKVLDLAACVTSSSPGSKGPALADSPAPPKVHVVVGGTFQQGHAQVGLGGTLQQGLPHHQPGVAPLDAGNGQSADLDLCVGKALPQSLHQCASGTGLSLDMMTAVGCNSGLDPKALSMVPEPQHTESDLSSEHDTHFQVISLSTTLCKLVSFGLWELQEVSAGSVSPGSTSSL
eukprot:gene8179-1435_t